MSTSTSSIFPILFHVGNAIALLAFLLRDQLWLRLVLVVSFALQALYYFALPGGPLYDPLFWKIMWIAANLAMIAALFRDRLPYGIDGDLTPLFKRISVLTHGQFRRLIRPTERIKGSAGAPPILSYGEQSSALYYLIAGTASVHKHGRTIPVAAGSFLGEIAFLTHSGATATVTLDEGAECLSWPAEALVGLLAKDPALDIAMRGLFNHDLAGKVSASPLSHGPTPEAA
ncbi:MAG: cyclic nucleotide-binding domain-containing protein [Bauldia sp.]